MAKQAKHVLFCVAMGESKCTVISTATFLGTAFLLVLVGFATPSWITEDFQGAEIVFN